MANVMKLTFMMECSNVQNGRAQEFWFVAPSTTYDSIQSLAQARADCMGTLASVKVVERTLYNIGPLGRLIRQGRLPAVRNDGAPGWISSVFVDDTVLADSASNKGVGCPVELTFAAGKTNYSTQAYPPYVLTQDEGSNPAGGDYAAARPLWLAAVANYSDALVALGAQHQNKFYPNPDPITGGQSGTDTAVAQVFVPGNQTAKYTAGLRVHVGGRFLQRRRNPNFRHDPLSGDHYVQRSSFLSDDGTFTVIPLTCTLGGFFDPCRANGYIAPINYQLLDLISYNAFAQGKSRRSSRTGRFSAVVH